MAHPSTDTFFSLFSEALPFITQTGKILLMVHFKKNIMKIYDHLLGLPSNSYCEPSAGFHNTVHCITYVIMYEGLDGVYWLENIYGHF